MRMTACNRQDFSRDANIPVSTTYDLNFCYLPGVNAGRWSPRAAPFYLVTITLGCMKCATGIQPSPHNSPIYDWAKLLSMRRIKSRARVQEKSAGRRDGRPRRRSSRSRAAFPRTWNVSSEKRGQNRRARPTRPSPRAGVRRIVVFPRFFSAVPTQPTNSSEIKRAPPCSRASAALRWPPSSANHRSPCRVVPGSAAMSRGAARRSA